MEGTRFTGQFSYPIVNYWFSSQQKSFGKGVSSESSNEESYRKGFQGVPYKDVLSERGFKVSLEGDYKLVKEKTSPI